MLGIFARHGSFPSRMPSLSVSQVAMLPGFQAVRVVTGDFRRRAGTAPPHHSDRAVICRIGKDAAGSPMATAAALGVLRCESMGVSSWGIADRLARTRTHQLMVPSAEPRGEGAWLHLPGGHKRSGLAWTNGPTFNALTG